MPIDSDTASEIYADLEDRITNKIPELTNFTQGSFNRVWARDGVAEHLHDFQAALVAAQLSGWVEYAGATITEEDLDELGIDGVDPEDVNEKMADEDLDHLAAINGISRDPGEQATGVVEFETAFDSIVIPEGTEVATQPDASGQYYSYFTTEETSPASGETTCKANIEAEDVGSEYNVGSNQVTHLPNPPSGVDGVTNPNPIGDGNYTNTDGETLQEGLDEETNESLRERVKTALTGTSGGGTTNGIVGYLTENIDGVSTATVVEHPSGTSDRNYPHAEVIVEGGTDSEVESAIDTARPSAVEHLLTRPSSSLVSVNAALEGDSSVIDVGTVENAISNYLTNLDLGDDVYRDKIIQIIMNADNDIENIDTLTISITSEVHTYDSDNSTGDAANHPLYKLDKGDSMEVDGITEVRGILNGASHTFTEGTDYEEGTVDGSDDDAIDWGLSGDNPDEDTDFEVDYTIANDIPIDDVEAVSEGNVNVSVK